MLLVEPPQAFEEWTRSLLDHARLAYLFSVYCERYRAAVLSQPNEELSRIWAQLSQGLRQCDVSPEFLHVVIERELKEEDPEASGKAAKLILLTRMVDLLDTRGVHLHDKTRKLLDDCHALIPKTLGLAVMVHFGLLKDRRAR
jgi:hypothetical protein